MRRREFIGLLGGAAAAWTWADVFAAQKSPIARLGYLIVGVPQTECCATPECRSVRWDCQSLCPPACSHRICVRSAGAKARICRSRSAAVTLRACRSWSAELVALRPDVLIANGSDETKDIPIVFQASSDPVGYGLVDSVARPGRNITGIALAPQMLWGKRLELLVELLGHRPAKIAWLSNPEAVSAKLNEAAVMQSAEKLGIEVARWEVRNADDLERVFAIASGNEAVLVQALSLTFIWRGQIFELAARHRLPTVCEANDYVVAGGLMSYGFDYRVIFGYGPRYVDRILRVLDLRICQKEQASKFELVINLKTANALGVTVPSALLVRIADEVIDEATKSPLSRRAARVHKAETLAASPSLITRSR
jgi:putative tryptophan/tyrosine transport system substrate-binding protein